jgi:hypothetical protein
MSIGPLSAGREAEEHVSGSPNPQSRSPAHRSDGIRRPAQDTLHWPVPRRSSEQDGALASCRSSIGGCRFSALAWWWWGAILSSCSLSSPHCPHGLFPQCAPQTPSNHGLAQVHKCPGATGRSSRAWLCRIFPHLRRWDAVPLPNLRALGLQQLRGGFDSSGPAHSSNGYLSLHGLSWSGVMSRGSCSWRAISLPPSEQSLLQPQFNSLNQCPMTLYAGPCETILTLSLPASPRPGRAGQGFTSAPSAPEALNSEKHCQRWRYQVQNPDEHQLSPGWWCWKLWMWFRCLQKSPQILKRAEHVVHTSGTAQDRAKSSVHISRTTPCWVCASGNTSNKPF